jgi:hypothetical protein
MIWEKVGFFCENNELKNKTKIQRVIQHNRMSKQKEIAVNGHVLYNSYAATTRHDTNGVINLKAHPFEEESRTSRGDHSLALVNINITYSSC